MLILDLLFYLKTLYDDFFFPKKLTIAEQLKIIHDKLDALYERPQDKYLTSEDSCIADGELFTGQGIITHLYGDYGYINDTLYFSREMGRNLQLQEGLSVVYIARKLSEDIPVQIYMIKSVSSENWDFDATVKSVSVDNRSKTTLTTHEKWLHGVVVGVERDRFSIKPSDTKMEVFALELSRIDCTFLPMIGDDVSVLALCETDESSHDYSGVIIEMRRLIPTNKKLYAGIVDKFPANGSYGTVDRDYIFYMNALQHSDNLDHKVDEGDRVIAEVISCAEEVGNYKRFNWRCIKIIKDTESFQANDVAALPLCTDYDEDGDDTRGIQITKSKDLKVLFTGNVTLNETKQIPIIVQNNSDNDHTITGVTYKFQNGGFQVNCSQFEETLTIPSGRGLVYTVDVTSRIFGICYERIVFTFAADFTIERSIQIDVVPGTNSAIEKVKASHKVAKHTKEYTKNIWNQKVDVQPGIRVKEAPHFVYRRLRAFEVPKMLLDAVLETTSQLNVGVRLESILPSFSPLELNSYKQCFQALLHLEEIALDHEFRKYDRTCAHFIRENTGEGQFLSLRMDNVMESRPSIIIGDRVYVGILNGENSASNYEGFIHKIRKNRLLIRFGDNFHSRYNGEDCRIHFKFTRSQFIKQHNAVETVSDKKILFPSRVVECPIVQLDVSLSAEGELISNYRGRVLPWFNPKLNMIQKKGIQCILRGESRPMPYIIFGPPGTGKTATMVELILQLFKRVGGSRIIVCAPSNSAANIIAKRIVDSNVLMKGEFVRIVSKNSVERELIPDELLPYSAMPDIATPDTTDDSLIKTKSGLLLNANSVSLSSYKLLISTCASFGSLMYMKFKQHHFTHVIIDEAGQCMESEAMIPISLLTKSMSQIILAGDPMQLGPVVTSKLAKDRGLAKSFLVRLLDRIPYTKYSEEAYDNRTVTKLLYNYRSLPSVLSVYNKSFYDNELIATISETDSHEMRVLSKVHANIHKLLPPGLYAFDEQIKRREKKYGIFFVGVRGREEQVTDSSSWCNRSEVFSVFYAVKGLIALGYTEADIGVITPYSLQVREIRDLLEVELHENLPKIGSVEEFQGQERNIIIISTVRSNVTNIETDLKYNLGFVKNAKRMNVAISRARAVLVVFGNPDILIGDSDWRSLIMDCYNNGTYYGCDLPAGYKPIDNIGTVA